VRERYVAPRRHFEWRPPAAPGGPPLARRLVSSRWLTTVKLLAAQFAIRVLTEVREQLGATARVIGSARCLSSQRGATERKPGHACKCERCRGCESALGCLSPLDESYLREQRRHQLA
jgi:hypothetical protein